jgi:hypothetical protein
VNPRRRDSCRWPVPGSQSKICVNQPNRRTIPRSSPRGSPTGTYVLSSLAGLVLFLAHVPSNELLGYGLSPAGLGWSAAAEFLQKFRFLHNIQASRNVYIEARPPAEAAAGRLPRAETRRRRGQEDGTGLSRPGSLGLCARRQESDRHSRNSIPSPLLIPACREAVTGSR